MTRRLALLPLAALFLAEIGACRRIEPHKLDPVRALKTGVQPAFKPPENGLLTDAQIQTFVKVRRGARAESEAESLRAIGTDPVEFAWIRARVREALLALESDRVTAAAAESYARALSVVREARRSARDPKTIARLDSEIAGLERERAALRKENPPSAALQRNAARLAPRRAEIEAAGP